MPKEFPLEARRSERLPLRMPVRLRIVEDDGRFNSTQGWTVVVNKNGARIECPHTPRMNQKVEVANPAIGRSATGSVVWLAEDRNDNGFIEFGVAIPGAESLWGVRFPG